MPYLLKKFGYMLATLWLVITITFALMKAIPGDPFMEDKALPPEIVQGLKNHYGLNDPWYKQYAKYLQSVAQWDFGPSFIYKERKVNEIINEGFPISATLGLEALLIASCAGVFLGSVAALKHNRWQDSLAMLAAVAAVSIPNFVLAALLQYTLAVKLPLFPVARWGTFMQSILPALSLAALPTACIARLIRASILEVLQQDYIKTAAAKGLPPRKILTNHIMRNAFLPVITYIGPLMANILVGSFIVEKIFGIPGLGQHFVQSVINRDYTTIMGITVFYSLIMLSCTFTVDIIYGFLDPRIKLHKVAR